jgi:hypothetical protein
MFGLFRDLITLNLVCFGLCVIRYPGNKYHCCFNVIPISPPRKPDGKAFLPRGQINRVIVSVTPVSQTRVAFYVYITEVEPNTSQALLCITTDNLANYKFISKTISWHVQGEHPHTGPRN